MSCLVPSILHIVAQDTNARVSFSPPKVMLWITAKGLVQAREEGACTMQRHYYNKRILP